MTAHGHVGVTHRAITEHTDNTVHTSSPALPCQSPQSQLSLPNNSTKASLHGVSFFPKSGSASLVPFQAHRLQASFAFKTKEQWGIETR